ncbi:MAG: DUF305 domain-containing protein [Cyanobacteriota bacterium]
MHTAHPIHLGCADESFDLQFIDAMIPHHESAVLMAEEALENPNSLKFASWQKRF